MVSLHHSYDQDGLGLLIRIAEGHRLTQGHVLSQPFGLEISLGCYRNTPAPEDRDPQTWYVNGAEPWTPYIMKSYFLQLILESGKWRPLGIVSLFSKTFWMNALRHQGLRFFAFTNDYPRIYLHHRRSSQRDFFLRGRCKEHGVIQYLHLQNASLEYAVHELQTPDSRPSSSAGGIGL